MKIVSKFKDYYDHVAHVLGVDQALRYERLPFKESRLFDGSVVYDDQQVFDVPRDVVDAYSSDIKTPFFRRRWGFTEMGDRRYALAVYVGGMAFTAWGEIVGKNTAGDYVYGPMLAREQVECPDWLHGISAVIDAPVFVVRQFSVSRQISGNNSVVVDNHPPNLAEAGLPRFVDAYTVYAAIQTWMENARNVNAALNGIPPADNKIKIQAAGFDLKTSFRKR